MTPTDQIYNPGLMAGRLNTKEAPPFGQRMATLRQRKGLTQTQLAARMNTSQKMIDYYERRSPNPTLDVMQKIAAALEISVTELLGEEAVAVRKARTNGPVAKVREVFDRVSKLPRRQQEHIVNWVSAYVSHYEQNRQS
jgi:transcriptional regulator with XRE-family HTH domain